MKLDMQTCVAKLSFPNTISLPDSLGVQRSRKAVYYRVQKPHLQTDGGEAPNRSTPDRSAIRISDIQCLLCAAVDPGMNASLHIRLFATHTTALIQNVLGESREKHDVDDAVFLLSNVDWHKTIGNRYVSV